MSLASAISHTAAPRKVCSTTWNLVNLAWHAKSLSAHSRDRSFHTGRTATGQLVRPASLSEDMNRYRFFQLDDKLHQVFLLRTFVCKNQTWKTPGLGLNGVTILYRVALEWHNMQTDSSQFEFCPIPCCLGGYQPTHCLSARHREITMSLSELYRILFSQLCRYSFQLYILAISLFCRIATMAQN